MKSVLAAILIAWATAPAVGAAAPGQGIGSVPSAVGDAREAWKRNDTARAKALIATLVACDEPHALVLWARMHEGETDAEIGRKVGEAYAKAAIAGHPSAHLALAHNHAGKRTPEGDIAAYAHLIEYGWITGGSETLRQAMAQHARRLDEAAELKAYEEAQRWRGLREAYGAYRSCSEDALWL